MIVQVAPPLRMPADVDYRWDPDTDILAANCKSGAVAEGPRGSLELTGKDGSWLILDIASGDINGVEVAVWPDVRRVQRLALPADVEDGRIVVPSHQRNTPVVEFETSLVAEVDQAERTMHFLAGPRRKLRPIRIARDILIEVDESSTIAGVWLLNVPPFPADT